MARETSVGVRLGDDEVEVVDVAAVAMGVAPERAPVLRRLAGLLPGAPDKAPEKMAAVHRFLLSVGSRAADCEAVRLEEVVRLFDPVGAEALTEARQAQAGGAA